MKSVNIRLDDEVIMMLDDLVAAAATTRPKLIETMIRAEHDKLNGNPKLKALLEQMRVLEAQLKDVAKK